jgi:hypothetical protein
MLLKEMDKLIGPLYKKIERYQALEPFYLDDRTEEKSCEFWEDIKVNKYLTQSDLCTLIGDYLKIIE